MCVSQVPKTSKEERWDSGMAGRQKDLLCQAAQSGVCSGGHAIYHYKQDAFESERGH